MEERLLESLKNRWEEEKLPPEVAERLEARFHRFFNELKPEEIKDIEKIKDEKLVIKEMHDVVCQDNNGEPFFTKGKNIIRVLKEENKAKIYLACSCGYSFFCLPRNYDFLKTSVSWRNP